MKAGRGVAVRVAALVAVAAASFWGALLLHLRLPFDTVTRATFAVAFLLWTGAAMAAIAQRRGGLSLLLLLLLWAPVLLWWRGHFTAVPPDLTTLLAEADAPPAAGPAADRPSR